MASRRTFLQSLLSSVAAGVAGGPIHAQGTPLNPLSLTKYIDPLPTPAKLKGANLLINMAEISQKLHASLPSTTLWGYNGLYPGPTIEAKQGVPLTVQWVNLLPNRHLLPVDDTLHRAITKVGVPAVVHLHGGETEPESDGHPDAWFTPGYAEKGPAWKKRVFTYHNAQLPTTLWYHDHALGLTRLNVMAGLAAFYLLRDDQQEKDMGLPSGQFEREIVIQDRSLTTAGQLLYPATGINPDIHPAWVPEFFGDIIVVNGKVWPYLEVQARKYRFRLLNGSNARFYRLSLEGGLPFQQIGTDGGFLPRPVTVSELLLAPGERADVVVDFSKSPLRTLRIMNSAAAPFPTGDSPVGMPVGEIMQFRVVAPQKPDDSKLPTSLVSVPALPAPVRTRTLTLNEVMGANGPVAMFLDGKMWDAPVSERPRLGSTEMWQIVNLTADTHPMHLHLVQFQLVNRQPFDSAGYMAAFDAANPVIPSMDGQIKTVPLTPFLKPAVRTPDANERGWKDTVRMNPGEVTRIKVRWAQSDGSPYPFNATHEPGYVWHCHILEHEDNEMMRPYAVAGGARSLITGVRQACASGENKYSKEAKRFSEAGAKLDDALDLSLWTGEDRLDPSDGKNVFAKTKDAAKKLQELLNGKTTVPVVFAEGLLMPLGEAARLLAATAIADCKNAGVTKALDMLDKGDDAIADDKYDAAVDSYGKAWEEAMK